MISILLEKESHWQKYKHKYMGGAGILGGGYLAATGAHDYASGTGEAQDILKKHGVDPMKSTHDERVAALEKDPERTHKAGAKILKGAGKVPLGAAAGGLGVWRLKNKFKDQKGKK